MTKTKLSMGIGKATAIFRVISKWLISFVAMRLGQIARELSIKPEAITAFLLKEQGIKIALDRNTKLDERQVELVSDWFVQKSTEAALDMDIIEESENFPDENQDNKEVSDKDPALEPETEPAEPIAPIETIKAPKIELEGLKVVDKIELPEPEEKQPDLIEIDGVMVERKRKRKTEPEKKVAKEQLERERKEKQEAEKQARAEQENKRQYAKETRELEEQQRQVELKARQDAENKKKSEEYIKEQRKHHYQKIRQSQQPTKKRGTKKKLAEEADKKAWKEKLVADQAHSDMLARKSAFGRFWHWLMNS